MSNKTECLRCGGGLIKRFDHYECVDCHYPSDDFHFEQNEEIKRLREALELFTNKTSDLLIRRGINPCEWASYRDAVKALEV